MNDLNLDETVIALFSSWSFPRLKSLTLFMNFIGDDDAKLWLTKMNFSIYFFNKNDKMVSSTFDSTILNYYVKADKR